MFLSTNKGMCAPMGSQPCLKKALQMMTTTQNKDDSPLQCHVRVHCQMCCAVLKNVTTYPPPNPNPNPNPYISEMTFSHRFQKIYTSPPPYVMTCLHIKPKLVKNLKNCRNTQSWQLLN